MSTDTTTPESDVAREFREAAEKATQNIGKFLVLRSGCAWTCDVDAVAEPFAPLAARLEAAEAEVRRLRESCRELVEAMQRYQMDVDDAPPFPHRAMMERAKAALEAR